MIIICYRENEDQKYDCVDTLEAFEQKHPNVERTYIFNGKSVINHSEMNLNPIDTSYYRSRYGIDQSDIGRRFYNEHGEKCVILGIKQQRYKYPITFYNETTDSIRKCSPSYIRRVLAQSASFAPQTT